MDLELAQLRTLVAVIDEGTLEAAARRLHVTPSAVSQRLRALEMATGRVLLRAGGRSTVTASGEAVLRLARQVGLLVADAGRAAGAGRRRPFAGCRSRSMPTRWPPGRCPRWRRWPGSSGSTCTARTRTHTSALLRAGTVMGAVTSEAEPVPGCRVTALGSMRYLPCAAQAYAARWFPQGPDATGARGGRLWWCSTGSDDLQHAYLRRHLPETGASRSTTSRRRPSTSGQ